MEENKNMSGQQQQAPFVAQLWTGFVDLRALSSILWGDAAR